MPADNKQRKDCKTKCDFDVGVELESKPKVSCKQLNQRGTQFDIAIDFDIEPRCQVRPKKCVDKNPCGCGTRCEFTVDIDFECRPKVLCNPCGKPSAQYKVDVEIDQDLKCFPVGKKNNSESSSYSEKKEDHKEDHKEEHKKDEHKKDEHKKVEKKDEKKKKECNCDVCKKNKTSSKKSESSSSDSKF